LVQYTQELSTLQEEANKLHETEQETLRVSLEKRWEIRRNARLTRIHWLLTIFSLWPAVVLISFSLLLGFIGGALVCQNAHRNSTEMTQ
jgi:hypothetical protein